MKFLHLGDLHLGRSLNDISLLADQADILNKIKNIALEEEADAVLIAGDVYDRSIPSEEAVMLLDRFLTELADNHITVILISGNHDSDERLNFGSSLLRARGIHIVSIYDGTVPCVTLEDEYGPVHFYCLPFVKASRVRYFHPELDTDTYDAAIRSAISVSGVNPEERNVILSHQFVVSGSKDPVSAGSENTAAEQVGTIEKVDVSAYEAFDYVALGHIHSPQRAGRDTARYSGSPLKYSLSEIGHEKSVPVITMKEKGNIDIELKKLTPLHEMRHIKGPLAKLTDPANITDADDYIYATLTDEEIIPDAISILRNDYPNIMKLNYQNSHTAAIENFDFSKITAKTSFADLMRDFYAQVIGGEPSEEEWQILREAAGEAGVEDEAG